MTPKLRHIFGCELCIFLKGMQIDLNIFITRLVIDLQLKSVRRHICNSIFSTKCDAYYKDKIFLSCECLHATIKDAPQCISCLPIKPNNMLYIKCDLSFCDECPEYNIFDEELDDERNFPLVLFSIYPYQGICEKHGIIPIRPSLC